jgi:hypothetical protein
VRGHDVSETEDEITWTPVALQEWFGSDLARRGGVIRQKRENVDKLIGMRHVIREARNRGWHVIENGGYVVVFCNDEGLIIRC